MLDARSVDILREHQAATRRLLNTRADSAQAEAPEEALRQYVAACGALWSVFETACGDHTDRDLVVEHARVSLALVALKEREFGVTVPRDALALFDLGDGDGGAPIGAGLKPIPPVRTGRDAKSLPAEDEPTP